MITPFQQWLIDVEQAAFDDDVEIDEDHPYWREAFQLDLSVAQAIREYQDMVERSKTPVKRS